MKLSELIAAVGWADVKASLLWSRPGVETSIEGYRQVLTSLRKLDAVASDTRLVLRERFREGRDEASFVRVVGRDGTRNRDLEDFQYLGQSADPEYADAETDYSLALEPWEHWLGMDIEPQTLAAHTGAQIVAHCLWEMTAYGFEPSQIQAERDDLKQRIDELEAMTEEERKEQLIRWEQVKKDLENKGREGAG